MQYDALSWQWPPEQNDEQHSLSFPHSLPAVLHTVLSAAHLLPSHTPPQHCASPVQAAPSDTHALALHCLLEQRKLQQSVAVVQAAPSPPHDATSDEQVLVLPSHTVEQQSEPLLQLSPKRLQSRFGNTPPSLSIGTLPSTAPPSATAPLPPVPPPPVPPVPVAVVRPHAPVGLSSPKKVTTEPHRFDELRSCF